MKPITTPGVGLHTPKQISIINERGMYHVIADGWICDHLTWDEMLGHIARITLGLPGYHVHALGFERVWPKIKGLLRGNV